MEDKDKFILEMKQKIESLEKSWDCYTWDKWKSLLEETLKYLEKKNIEVDNTDKKLHISDVSGQLVDFLTWYIHESEFSKNTYSIKLIVDEYLKSTNLH